MTDDIPADGGRKAGQSRAGDASAGDLAAGSFSTWLGDIGAAIRGERSSDVPCDGCTACCTASQFIHIGPDEKDTIAHIPSALLFPAPGLPHGHVLLGYDNRGHCPLLVDGACSIYEHRPRTCRTYDCRVFAATGIDADEAGKEQIAERARRWKFDFSTETAVKEHAAVRAAASFLTEHADELPPGAAPQNATQRAVLAIEIRRAFDETPSPEAVRAAVLRVRPARS